MKLRSSLSHIQNINMIHVLPLMDIIFLTLFFFILFSPLVSDPHINVHLPKAVASSAIEEDIITITVTSENILYLNDKIVTMKKLSSILEKDKDGRKTVLLKVDRRASMDQIFAIWDICRDLGIENINIATNQEK